MTKVGNRQVDRIIEFAPVPSILSACIVSDEFNHYTHKFEDLEGQKFLILYRNYFERENMTSLINYHS